MSGQTLFIVCSRPACRALKAVPSRWKQRRQKYCSRRCVGLVCVNVSTLTPAQRRASGVKSARVRRAQAMRRLKRLSKIEIYRLAFSTGWKAGARSARRRMTITPGDRS